MFGVVMEEWRPLTGFEEYYEVSSEGQIRRSAEYRSTKAGKILKQKIGQYGYPLVVIHTPDLPYWGKNIQVHRAVALAFLGEPEEGQEVCHNDGDRMNSSVSNLRWDTHRGNMADAVRHGTHKNVGKKVCKHGHDLTDGNIYYDKNRNRRQCRICVLRRQSEYQARKRARQE